MSNKFRSRIAAVCAALERGSRGSPGSPGGAVFVECEHPEALAPPNPTEREMAEAARRGYPVARVRALRPGFYEVAVTEGGGRWAWSSAERGDAIAVKLQEALDEIYGPAGEEPL